MYVVRGFPLRGGLWPRSGDEEQRWEGRGGGVFTRSTKKNGEEKAVADSGVAKT